MLGGVNSTNICLVPKVKNPIKVNQYRPISCCKTIYKCISKILASRMKTVIPYLISHNQGAFVASRHIVDNILLAHEIIKGYDRKSISPRCLLKIDIMKAFDTTRWESISYILDRMGFPEGFRKWVLACISTPSYSVILNGQSVGYFKGMQGLRQGDPISVYPFIMIMEFLTALLISKYRDRLIKLHPKCRNPLVTNLCFADDLLIFTKPNDTSLAAINDTQTIFRQATGLQMNQTKSAIFIAGCSHEKK